MLVIVFMFATDCDLVSQSVDVSADLDLEHVHPFLSGSRFYARFPTWRALSLSRLVVSSHL